MNNFLLYVGGFLVMVLAALFAGPHFIDWNGYRGVFEEEATRMLGREVRVGGSVNVRLLPSPYVRFEKLRIADTEGTSGESLFRADDFTMWLSVPPLLRGVLEANEVELSKPVLLLAANPAGEGNWRTLSIQPGTLPFVPSDVTLNSVKIIDGAIGFRAPSGAGLVQLEHVNGEFSAEALNGPFKFKGAAAWRGDSREVWFSTGDLDAGGTMPFKAQIKAVKTQNTYSIDGTIADLKGRPRIEGEVAARLPLPKPRTAAALALPDANPETVQDTAGASTGDTVQSTVTPAGVAAANGPPEIDFKSKLSGDATGLTLGDIAISIENAGAPQLMNGAAKIVWAGAIESDVSLTSRWLDVDRLTGGASGEGPLATLEMLINALAEAVPGEGKGRVMMAVDQVQFGGDSVSPLRIEVVRDGATLELRQLGAGLPGGARADVSGSLVPGTDGLGFKGRVTVSGSTLQRFAAWAGRDPTGGGPLGGLKADGAFWLDGDLDISRDMIALKDTSGEIGDVPLSGGLAVSRGEKSAVTVALAGPKIDLDALGLSETGLADWPRLAFGRAPASAAQAAADGAEPDSGNKETGMKNVRLNLVAGELVTRGTVLNGFSGEIANEDGRLTLANVKFAAGDGLALTFDGDVAGLGSEPKGVLRYTVHAETSKAAAVVARWIEDRSVADEAARNDTGVDALERQAQHFAPLRIAGSVVFGDSDNPRAAVVTADGMAKDGRVIAKAVLANGFKIWRQGSLDLTASIESADPGGLLASLVSSDIREAALEPQRGRLTLKAVGIPARGVLAAASVEGTNLVLGFNGKAVAAEGKPLAIDGDLRIAAADARDAVQLTGLKPLAALTGVPLTGIVHVGKSADELDLRLAQATLGKAAISGWLKFAVADGGQRNLSGDIRVSEAELKMVLGVVLAPRPTGSMQPTAGRAVTVAGQQKPAPAKAVEAQLLSVWPEEAFDFASIDGLTGAVRVAFDKLTVEPGLTARDVSMAIAIKDHSIEAGSVEGKVSGGVLSGSLAVSKTAGGVDVIGGFKVEDAKLASLLPSDLAIGQSTGTMGATFQIAGRAQSPAALMTVLKGSGQIAVSDSKLAGPSAQGLTATVEQVAIGKADSQGERFTAALAANMAASETAFPAQKLAIEIANGVVKIAPLTAISSDGKSAVVTTIDLQTLAYYADWRLQTTALSARTAAGVVRQPLPEVSILYSGPLQTLGQAQPKFSTAALERELSVRKLEQAVDELERLRKLDEERAVRERERLKAIEAEKAKLLETAPDQPAEPAPVPGEGAPPQGQSAEPPLPSQGATLPQGAPVPGVPVPPPVGTVQAGQPGTTTPAVAPEANDALPQAAVPTPRPAQRPKPRRSPGDDILRSLGGIP